VFIVGEHPDDDGFSAVERMYCRSHSSDNVAVYVWCDPAIQRCRQLPTQRASVQSADVCSFSPAENCLTTRESHNRDRPKHRWI